MVTVEIYEFVRLFFEVPIYHLILEAVLIIWVLSLILKRNKKSSKSSLSEKASLWNRLSEHEKEELIQEWTPEPLVPDDADVNPLKYDVIQGKVGKHVTIGGHQYLNAATHNFLGMVGDERVEAAAVKCLHKYGVGSCGPRAFYGTIDVHLDLEKRVTQFLGTEEAVLYSLGFSTVASAIPAYAKRSDVIFADEAVCFAIQKGLQASRSEIRYFRHNDTAHLEQLIEEHNRASKKKPKQAALVRRFLVVEGIYTNTGAVCPLPELLRLKEAHKLRLFVDESLSFGVLGDTGRGLTEHFGVTARDVDLICVSMEASLGSVGGFTTGSFYVADHQRLSGQGYVFSAALAPLCAAAAMCAIDLLDEHPEMTARLRGVCRSMHQALSNIDGLELSGDEISPIKFLTLSQPRPERRQSEELLQSIVDECREAGIALTRARYLESEEHRPPPPAIRITCTRLMEPEDVRSVETALIRAAGQVLG